MEFGGSNNTGNKMFERAMDDAKIFDRKEVRQSSIPEWKEGVRERRIGRPIEGEQPDLRHVEIHDSGLSEKIADHLKIKMERPVVGEQPDLRRVEVNDPSILGEGIGRREGDMDSSIEVEQSRYVRVEMDTDVPSKLADTQDQNSHVTEREGRNEVKEVKSLIQNKEDGLRREADAAEDLSKKYPEEQGYKILREVYLRDENGNIVRDPETGEGRRIDFVVTKDGEVVDSVEVTSKTADKTSQEAKEKRIRDAGGNYIRDNDGNLIKIPSSVQTRIERRD